MRRLNESEHHSVEIRQIENGWIERRSRSDGDGYSSVERFHTERPMVEGAQKKEPTSKSSALRDAASFANKGKAPRG